MPASGPVVTTRCVLGYAPLGGQLSSPYMFPSGPGSAICHPSHPRSPVSVNTLAEMEGVRVTKVTFPQKKGPKPACLCHLPVERLSRGS